MMNRTRAVVVVLAIASLVAGCSEEPDSQATQQIAEQQAELARLRGELELAQQRAGDATAESIDLENKLSDAEDALDETRDQVLQLTIERDELHNEADKALTDLKDVSTQLATQVARTRELEGQVKQLGKTIEEFQDKLAQIPPPPMDALNVEEAAEDYPVAEPDQVPAAQHAEGEAPFAEAPIEGETEDGEPIPADEMASE